MVGAWLDPRRPSAVALLLLPTARCRDDPRHGGRPTSAATGAAVTGPGGWGRLRGAGGRGPVLGPDGMAATAGCAVGPSADAVEQVRLGVAAVAGACESDRSPGPARGGLDPLAIPYRSLGGVARSWPGRRVRVLPRWSVAAAVRRRGAAGEVRRPDLRAVDHGGGTCAPGGGRPVPPADTWSCPGGHRDGRDAGGAWCRRACRRHHVRRAAFSRPAHPLPGRQLPRRRAWR